MSTLPISELNRSIVELLIEGYKGPPDAKSPTWFVDNDQNAGIFGQITPVTAAEASISADHSGNPGTTVASHVEHLRWSLANDNGALRGEPYKTNWGESWLVATVTKTEWAGLKENLRSEFDTICAASLKRDTLEGPFLNGLLALPPHTAYHLATIRQILERIRA